MGNALRPSRQAGCLFSEGHDCHLSGWVLLAWLWTLRYIPEKPIIFSGRQRLVALKPEIEGLLAY